MVLAAMFDGVIRLVVGLHRAGNRCPTRLLATAAGEKESTGSNGVFWGEMSGSTNKPNDNNRLPRPPL